jgi:hypothetical protein
MSEQNEHPKHELTIDDVRHQLGLVVGAIKSSKNNIDTVITESKVGLTAINSIADKLKGMKYEGAHRVGDLLLAALEKSAAILDLDETVSPRIEQAMSDLREAYAKTIALVRERDQQVEQASALFESVKSASSHKLLLLPRPQSELFGSVEEGASDSFPVINNPMSVLSRIRFVKQVDDEGDTTIGIAVLSTLGDESAINYFYFENYLELCDQTRGKKLETGSQDGVFIYQQTVSLAIALADALVTQFGPLDSIVAGSHRAERPQSDSDVLSEITSVDSADDLENQSETTSIETIVETADSHDILDSDVSSFDPNDPSTWVEDASIADIGSESDPGASVDLDTENPDELAELSAQFPQ